MSAGRLYVVGTRSFAAEIAEFAEDGGFDVVGLLEPYEEERAGSEIHGLPVSWLEATEPTFPVAIATGERSRREIVARVVEAGFELATLVHPRAHVSRRATIGSGTVIAPGVVVGAHARIGENVLLARGVLVGHHTTIGPFATLNPGANVAGNVDVGADAFLAMGAVVRDHVRIGPAAVVAAGAVVVRDVPAGLEVRGVPAVERVVERT